MVHVGCLTFNPFQENTYIVYDDSKECVIFDPGCFDTLERRELKDFITERQLTPKRLINTHCHIDHVFGNQFVVDQFGIGLEIHEGELIVLNTVPQVAKMYNIPLPDTLPQPTRFIQEGEQVHFGNTTLEAIFTPGHSPASLSFYCAEAKILIAGDVLFEGSIGRTDLPGGDYQTLINNIKEKLFPLGDEVKVYPGHGNPTTIGKERKTNPFLTA